MATGPANANMQNSNMAMTMVVVQQIVAASSIAAGRMARATGRMARATATTATAKKKTFRLEAKPKNSCKAGDGRNWVGVYPWMRDKKDRTGQ